MKLVPSSEIQQAEADVSERLQKMKAMLQRVGSGDAGSSADLRLSSGQPHSENHTHKQLQQQRHQLRVPHSSADRAAAPKQAPVVSRREAGTDPLESIMGGSASVHWFEAPRHHAGREIETQTALPPAPISVASETGTDHEELQQYAEQAELAGSAPEPQADSDQIEKEMKAHLMHYLSPERDDDNNNSTGESHYRIDGIENNQGNETQFIESPRIDPIKMAEQRRPPNPRSRQGYRSFHMPTSRLNSSKAG